MPKITGFFCLLSLSLLLPIIQATDFHPCGHASGPLPLEVKIDGCEKLPCRFQRGSNITAQVTFNASFDASHIFPHHNVQVGEVWMKFDSGLAGDGCGLLVGPQCPVKEGVTYTYIRHIPIQKRYPKIRIKVENEMKDMWGKSLFCYGVVALVVD